MSDTVMDRIRGANPYPTELPAPPIEPVLRRLGTDANREPPRAERRARASSLGTVAAVLSSGAAIAVAVLAIVLLSHRKSPQIGTTPRHQPATSAAYRPLTSILGVMRRPQTSADRDPSLMRLLRAQAHRRRLSILDGSPVLSLVRRATVTPWGAKVFLVPYQPLTPEAISKLPTKERKVARAARLGLETLSAGTTSGVPTVAQLMGGRDVASPASGRSNRFVMVVPDGVAKVALWRSVSTKAHPHPLVAPHSKPVVVTVHNNVAAFRARSFGFPGHEIWYGPSGKVIKRIANASACGPPLGNCA
jgi:hypothetical protein